MRRVIASPLLIASAMFEFVAALLRLAYNVVTWTPPTCNDLPPFIIGAEPDPFERWADREGRGPLASLKRDGSGMF